MVEQPNSLKEKYTLSEICVTNVGYVKLKYNFTNLTKDSGHQSYNCPKNTLGDRSKPQPKKKRKKPTDGSFKSQKPGKKTKDGSDDEDNQDENLDFWEDDYVE